MLTTSALRVDFFAFMAVSEFKLQSKRRNMLKGTSIRLSMARPFQQDVSGLDI